MQFYKWIAYFLLLASYGAYFLGKYQLLEKPPKEIQSKDFIPYEKSQGSYILVILLSFIVYTAGFTRNKTQILWTFMIFTLGICFCITHFIMLVGDKGALHLPDQEKFNAKPLFYFEVPAYLRKPVRFLSTAEQTIYSEMPLIFLNTVFLFSCDPSVSLFTLCTIIYAGEFYLTYIGIPAKHTK